ncbi:MAG: hypothetical protein ACR2MW_09255, partial [Chthoniobacterales bacterium]
RIGFDELLSALRSRDSRCLFGFGESDSDNRAHEALALALKNPLMDRGKMLNDASHVLVQISGGPGMTLTEVEIVMQELNRHVEDHTQILFGTSVDGKMGNRMSVTLISSIGSPVDEVPAPAAPPVWERAPVAAFAPPPVIEPPTPMPESPVPLAPEPIVEAIVEPPAPVEEEVPQTSMPVEAAAPPPPPPPAPVRREKKAPALPAAAAPLEALPPAKAPRKDKLVQAKQEILQFESITRGRFEKSEPTIVEGQDLDVPTYLRKNVRVK